jgi:hypothetical protein
MDGASMPTIEIAQKKAYTALFGVSTQDFFNFIQGDPSLLAGIPTLARVAAWGTQHSHQTAPTQFVGKADGVPIVFNQHYTGTTDHWNPAVTDGLARDREVILFNNAGTAGTPTRD